MSNIVSLERTVIKEVMQFGVVNKRIGKNLKYIEIVYYDMRGEFVWAKDKIVGLFSSFEQFNDYVYGGKNLEDDEHMYYFFKEDGTPFSPEGYWEWQTVLKREIKDKWHSKLQGSNDVFCALDGDDWVFIFPDGDIIDEKEIWK